MRLAEIPTRDALFAGEPALMDLARGLGRGDIARLLDEAFGALEAALAGIADAEVGFVPVDPAATDSADGRGWTVAHVVTHVTAGLEETSAWASTLARGAEVEGRPRYEVPWETIATADGLRRRLGESRRMCRAFLDTWPDEPHLANLHTPIPPLGPLNAVARMIFTCGHAAGHLPQVRETLRQAREADPGPDGAESG